MWTQDLSLKKYRNSHRSTTGQAFNGLRTRICRYLCQNPTEPKLKAINPFPKELVPEGSKINGIHAMADGGFPGYSSIIYIQENRQCQDCNQLRNVWDLDTRIHSIPIDARVHMRDVQLLPRLELCSRLRIKEYKDQVGPFKEVSKF